MPQTPAVFINWTEPTWIPWLWSELKAGRVRQSWGGPKTNLLDEQGHLREYADWVTDYVAFMSAGGAKPKEITDTKNTKRFSILRTLLEIEPGDIILYPRMPNEQFFATVEASGTYRFDDTHFSQTGQPDRPLGHPGRDGGHVITIAAATLKWHELAGSELAKLISKDFSYHRRAVNAVRNQEDAKLILQIHASS